MKKLILSVVASIVLCTAAITGYKVYENQNTSTQDILLPQNLEALTQNEQPDVNDCPYDPTHEC